MISKREDGAAHVDRFELELNDDPAVGVVEAVAAATDRDPLELPNIASEIDGDGLRGLLGGSASGDHLVQVTFDYAGVTVRMTNERHLSVVQ